jgi:hypothetical protein
VGALSCNNVGLERLPVPDKRLVAEVAWLAVAEPRVSGSVLGKSGNGAGGGTCGDAGRLPMHIIAFLPIVIYVFRFG